MKKAPSHDIFDLIKSMDKGEKRNFKLHASNPPGDREKQYIMLFDMIDKQDEYDEAKLIAQFKASYEGQFAVAKNYLFNLLLKSLSQADDSQLSELAALRFQVGILIEKELFGIAEKLIRKGVKEAEEIEAFCEQLQLQDLQMEVLLRNYKDDDLDKLVLEVRDTKRKVQRLMENADHFRIIRARLNAYWSGRRAIEGPESIQELFRQIDEDPMLADPSMALSATAKFDFHLVKRLVARARHLTEDQRDEDAINALVEQYPWLIQRNSIYYLRESMHKCYQLVHSGHYEKAAAAINEFEHQLPLNFPNRKDAPSMVLSLRLLLGYLSGRTSPIIKDLLDPQSDVAATLARSKHATEANILYYAAQNFFMAGDLPNALKWMSQCLSSRQDAYSNFHYLVRLLNLFIHFDRGNDTVVDSEIPSMKRYFEKNDLFGEYEQKLLKGLQKMNKSRGGRDESRVLTQVKQSLLEAVANSEQSRRKERIIRAIPWLESKEMNITLAERIAQLHP